MRYQEINWNKKPVIKNKSMMFLEQIKRSSLAGLFEVGSKTSILECIDKKYIKEYVEIVKEKFKDDELQDWILQHAKENNALRTITKNGKYFEVAVFINQITGNIELHLDLVTLEKNSEIISFHPEYNLVPNNGVLLFLEKEDAEEFVKLLKLSFDGVVIINEAVGIIVKDINTTDDVKEGETERQAKKFGNTIGKDGHPPLYWESPQLAAKEIK